MCNIKRKLNNDLSFSLGITKERSKLLRKDLLSPNMYKMNTYTRIQPFRFSGYLIMSVSPPAVQACREARFYRGVDRCRQESPKARKLNGCSDWMIDENPFIEFM